MIKKKKDPPNLPKYMTVFEKGALFSFMYEFLYAFVSNQQKQHQLHLTIKLHCDTILLTYIRDLLGIFSTVDVTWEGNNTEIYLLLNTVFRYTWWLPHVSCRHAYVLRTSYYTSTKSNKHINGRSSVGATWKNRHLNRWWRDLKQIVW